MRRVPPDHFNLTWHQRIARPGPGRKQRMVGSEVYPQTDLDRLMSRTQSLAVQGYLISITPPIPTTTPEAA